MPNNEDDRTVFMPVTREAAGDEPRLGLAPVAASNRRDLRPLGLSLTRLGLSTGLNSLVEAALPLLSEMTFLRFGRLEEELSRLRDRLESEVRSFEVRAAEEDLEQSHVIAARYLLCTALDEAINLSPLGESGQWAKLALLTVFHNETWGGEKFFQVLERCMRQPAKNIDLLELMYIIISLGFEGRYQIRERGQLELETLRDQVFQQIHSLRGESFAVLGPDIPSRKIPDKPPRHMSPWLVAGMSIFCLCLTFMAFSFILNHRADEVLGQYDLISPSAAGERISEPTDGDLD